MTTTTDRTDDDGDLSGLDDAALADRIRRYAGDIAAATARFLLAIGEFDERGGWVGSGIRSCAQWLSWKCALSPRTARDHVRVAAALRNLPRTRAAFLRGELSYSKVRAITRVADADTEKDLVDTARSSTASQLDRLVRGLRGVPDPSPDADDRRQQRPRPAHRLSWRWDQPTGDLVLSGRLPAEDGAALLAAFTHAEAERSRTADESGPDASGPAPSDARHALVTMAETVLTADAPAFSPAADVSFIVDRHGAHADGGTALTGPAAAMALCSPSGRRVDTAGGAVLRFGRKRRAPSQGQLRALHLRDGACRHPACGRTRFLHAHHVRHWSRGGATDLDNLVTLCSGCHRALHEGEFGIRAFGGQRFAFVDSAGDRMDAAPAIPGDAGRVRDPRRRAEAITGDWDGEPLHLQYAVSVLAEAWERDRREAAAA